MSGDDINPVQFGILIKTVEENTKAVTELGSKLEQHIVSTKDKINAIDLRDEKRKHFVLGALGAGAFGGATFGEVLKNFAKHLWP